MKRAHIHMLVFSTRVRAVYSWHDTIKMAMDRQPGFNSGKG